MVPRPFQSLRLLRNLNIVAVGLALATVTSAIFGLIVSSSGQFGLAAFVTGLPTLLIGGVWAAVLRWRKTIGSSPVRWGWLASVPLAMTNAGLAASVLMAAEGDSVRLSAAVLGFVLGCSVGAIVWVPAMLTTLVAFGVPIAWSQALARKGLAGEERGEWVVGLTCAALAVVGMLLALGAPHPVPYPLPALQAALEPVGRWLLYALGGLGALTGATTTFLARSRERQRRAFVAEAEAGKVTGYRVDATPEGKVLVRVTTHGEGYRVTDFREEVFALDDEGQAKQALFVDGPRQR